MKTANTTGTRIPRTVRLAYLYPPAPKPAPRRYARFLDSALEIVGNIGFWLLMFVLFRLLILVLC